MKSSQIATSPLSDSHLNTVAENSNMELQFSNPHDLSIQSSSFGQNPININNQGTDTSSELGSSTTTLVKNSPSDNIQNIFLAEKQPQWFVGRVLVKEFCIARKVCVLRFTFYISILTYLLILNRKTIDLKYQAELDSTELN